MLQELTPKRRADRPITHSDAGGLSTVMKLAASKRAEEERLPALRAGLHGRGVEGCWPSRTRRAPTGRARRCRPAGPSSAGRTQAGSSGRPRQSRSSRSRTAGAAWSGGRSVAAVGSGRVRVDGGGGWSRSSEGDWPSGRCVGRALRRGRNTQRPEEDEAQQRWRRGSPAMSTASSQPGRLGSARPGAGARARRAVSASPSAKTSRPCELVPQRRAPARAPRT